MTDLNKAGQASDTICYTVQLQYLAMTDLNRAGQASESDTVCYTVQLQL